MAFGERGVGQSNQQYFKCKVYQSRPKVAHGVPPRWVWVDSEIVFEFTLPRRAAERELMLFSFCFIGKQVRQVTMQFAFPCSL